jgi:hypothetical protein
MVELAVREGWPSPADLPQGEVYIRHDGSDIYIDRADPRILISGELFEGWHDDDDNAMVELRCTCESCPDSEDPALHCPIGDVVTLRAANRTVIYRITGYEPSVHCYIAEWPD